MRAVLATAGEVAGAMAYLHACGVLHADLSGNNVLLASSPADPRRWVAMVADFGMARIKGSPGLHSAPHGTVTHMVWFDPFLRCFCHRACVFVGVFVGTGSWSAVVAGDRNGSGPPATRAQSPPRFPANSSASPNNPAPRPNQSPEYLRGGPMTPEVDVWSFGCLLWEMCAGRRAYDNLSYHQVLHAVSSAEHVLPARGLPGVPAGVEDVLAACLALDPNARPTFEQLSKAIPALARSLKRQPPTGG